MDSAVESGFARSEELQKEWDSLKREMDRLVSQLARRPNEKQAKRKAVVEERMNAITAEMAAVLSEARKEVPATGYDVPVDDSNDSLEEEDQGEIKVDSRPERPAICRTYDSTESDEFEEDEDEDEDEEASPSDLRERMQREARARDPTIGTTTVTVQSRKGFPFVYTSSRIGTGDGDAPGDKEESDSGGRSGFGGGHSRMAAKLAKLRGLKTAFALKHASKPRELTEDEIESLRLESSRLERQARKLKKKERTPDESAEMSRIQARLGAISRELESGQTTRPLVVSDGEASTPNSSDASLPSPRAKRSSDLSPTTDPKSSHGSGASINSRQRASQASDANSLPASGAGERSQASSDSVANLPDIVSISESDDGDPVEDEREYETPKSKAMASLEQSVMSFKAFGRQKKQAIVARLEKMKEVDEQRSASDKPTSSRWHAGSAEGSAAGNPYVEVTDKLAERGEKLDSLSRGADEMREGAEDMASAAAALRKRQQKGGLFR